MDAVRLPFLSRLGERDRSPIRGVVWLTLCMLLFIVGVIPLGALLAVLDAGAVLEAAGDGPLADGPRRLIAETQFTFVLSATLAMMAIAVLIAARLAFHRPAWTFVSPSTPFRPRLLGAGFALFGLLVVAALMVERGLRGLPFDAPVFDADYALDVRLIYAAGSTLFLLLAAAAEELVFRGVLLQVTGAWVRRLPLLILVNGLAFSAFHLDASPGAFVARAVSGAVWTWTVLRLSGLEFAIGAHLANNLALALLIEPLSSGAQTGRAYPPVALAADLLTAVALVGCLLLALRSPRLRAWAEVDPPKPVEAAFD